MIAPERIIQIDGEDAVAVQVTAKLRLLTAADLPKEAINKATSAAKEPTNTIFWKEAENPDLVWCQFILDTEGANKNWDYMPRPAMAASYQTARYKPMDMEHVVDESSSLLITGKTPRGKNTIFGVMSEAHLADSDGKLLTTKEIDELDMSDDMSRTAANKLAVVGYAALWNLIFPKTVSDVVKQANKGELSVSMERWITKFDFLIRSGDEYKSVTKEDAIKLGYMSAWEKRQYVNGYPILRRSLKFLYGGVASTLNPANPACSFLEPEATPEMTKASASDPLVLKMLQVRCQIKEEFLVSDSERTRARLVEENLRVTRALASYLGWSDGRLSNGSLA